MPEQENSSSLNTLQSGLGYLMTLYSKIVTLGLPQCSACCATTITDHLKRLLDHEEIQQSQTLRNTYQKLLIDWTALTEHQENMHPVKQSMEREGRNGKLLH